MFSAGKNFISLDIGYGGIKAAKLNSAGKTLSLSHFIYEPYPAGEMENLSLDYLEIQVINFIKKHHIRGNVVFTLSDPSLTVQSFRLPVMPYDEIPEAVKWEISRSLKLDPNDILFDFVICNNSPDGEKDGIYILAGICSREPYVKIAKAMLKLKLKLLGCDLPVLSDFRVMDKLGYFEAEKTYIVMNFGALFTNLSIIYKKELIFNRRVSLNGILLMRAIKDYCKVDATQAEKLKTEHGLEADVLSDKIIESVNIINSNCEKMISDIQYSLKYFSYQVSRSNITTFDRVYITGGASQLHGFQEFAKDRLNIEVVPVTFENKISVETFTVPETEKPVSWMPFLTTVAGGTLWRRKALNRNCVNLLPGDLTEGGKKEFISLKTVFKRFFSVFGAVVFLLGFFAALLLTYRYQRTSINERVKLLEKEEDRKALVEKNNMAILNIKAEKVKENEKLERGMEILKRKLMNMKAYDVSETNPAYFIAEVVNLAPYPDIVINILSYQGDKLIIRGDASNNNVVSSFMEELNNSKYFYNTNFDFMEKISQEKTMYPINFKITTKVSGNH